uniref:Uncharacterized protein n=1 Tax=Leersia perrieri TaxID=77586 RepID=A0A0D9WN37_9ORYZ
MAMGGNRKSSHCYGQALVQLWVLADETSTMAVEIARTHHVLISKFKRRWKTVAMWPKVSPGAAAVRIAASRAKQLA